MMMTMRMWILLTCGLLFLPAFLTAPQYCHVHDLNRGLKFDGTQEIVLSNEYIDVHCYDIYKPGKVRITCMPGGRWSAEYPRCKLVTCTWPEDVPSENAVQESEVGKEVTFRCPEGYWFSGTNPQVCQEDGTWSGEEGQCLAVECPSLPPPDHGRFSHKPPYGYHARISVSCDPGFVYHGSDELLCQGNNTWLGTLGNCIEITTIKCPKYRPNGNATVTPRLKIDRYGDQIHITCPKGYTYNGTETRTCRADGTWSGTPGTCKLKTCTSLNQVLDPHTVRVARAMIVFSEDEFLNKHIMHMSGGTVMLVCRDGYRYTGSQLVCDEDGQWNGTKGSCSAVSCPDTLPISNGALNGTGWVYQDEADVSCHLGYRWKGPSPHAVCSSDGTWTLNGECEAVPCPDILPISKAILNGSGWVYKDEANVTCDPGYEWVGSSPHAVCTSDGTWQVNGECREFQTMDTYRALLHVVLPLLMVALVGAMSIFIYWRYTRHGRLKKKEHVDPESRQLLRRERASKENALKSAVLKIGHVVNRGPDKRIDLDTGFTKLRMVAGGGGSNVDERNETIPERYKAYLRRTGADNIEMENILNHVCYDTDTSDTGRGRKKRALLIEGWAGIGKSTLVQKMMRLWAQNVWATDFKAAFLFNIRNLTVLDKRSISLVDLFKYYSVYALREEGDEITPDLFMNEEENILIFMDGIDEFPGLENNLNCIEHLKLDDKAEPTEWCVNILRRDVLGCSSLILVSRPFKDLKHLKCSPVMEVVGLTEETILDFIDHHVAAEQIDRVRSSMTLNPLVMSVSSITYFCMMFTTVLEEDKTISTTELTTYTRITAFLIDRYMTRCPPRPNEEAPSCLLPLAKLAYRGLVERQPIQTYARLVFDQTDLEETGFTEGCRTLSEECGIMVSTNIEQLEEGSAISTQSQASEFVHLSVQELLSMSELLHKSKILTIEISSQMFGSSNFMMAQQYLFGLRYDNQDKYIKKLMKAVGRGRAGHAPEMSHDLVKILMTKLASESGDEVWAHSKLEAIQMAYESQCQDVAEKLSKVLFDDLDTLQFKNEVLTAVDMKAIIFMLQQARKICKLGLEAVTMDDICLSVFTKRLKDCSTLRGLSVKSTPLAPEKIQEVLEGLPEPEVFQELRLDNVGINEETESYLLSAIKNMSSITHLSLVGSQLSMRGFEEMNVALQYKDKLMDLSLDDSTLDDDALRLIVDALYTIRLKKLSLNGNKFSGPGIKQLMAWLKQDKSLEYLSLVKAGINDGSVEDVAAALGASTLLHNLGRDPSARSEIGEAFIPSTNNTLKSLDIRGEPLIGENVLSIILDHLRNNIALEALWYTHPQGFSRTLVPVGRTTRRIVVDAAQDGTKFYSWCLEDLLTSSALHHPGIVWSETSEDLHLNLTDQYTDLYGDGRPSISTEAWCQTLKQITSRRRRVRILTVALSPTTPLSTLFSSLTHDTLQDVIHSKVWMVVIQYGELTCAELLTWLSSVNSTSGWSVSGHTNGARVANPRDEYVLIWLWMSQITSSYQQKQQYADYMASTIRLLYEPKWTIQSIKPSDAPTFTL